MVKEFLAALRDPKARMLLVVPPIMQLCIFSFAITQEVKNVSLGVLNQDVGIEGAALALRFKNTPTFTNIVYLNNVSEIDAAIDRQHAIAILVIPQDFSKNLGADVQILLDGRKTNAAPIVGGYMQRIISNFLAEKRSLKIITRNWFNPNLNPQQSLVPCLICILGTVIGLTLSALSVARERETGTFDQILVSPLSPIEILIGKAIPALVLATFSGSLIAVIVIFGFGISLKSHFLLFVFSLEIFLLSIIGVGLFISSLAKTQQQAILGVFLVMPPFVMLSGFATPVENMPDWLQTITIVNPLRWMLVIVKGVFLKGMSPEAVLRNTIPIGAVALCTLISAVFMFKKRIY